MMIHLVSGQNMFRPQVRTSGLQKMIGQMQNSGLQKVMQQVNATYGSKKNRDTVELSPKALELLNASKTEKTNETKKQDAAAGYQKYPVGITRAEWAETAIVQQRNGIQTVSDVIDHAKSKLKFTMSKIDELENYLSGNGTHSDPNMTKELAETYLHNYKQSIQSDYKDLIQSHIGLHQSLSKESDDLSGGLASKAIENQLASITAESLGLANLSGDPQEIMEALDNASKILDRMTENVERAYAEVSGGKTFAEPARSTSLFDGNSSLSFFESQMENPHRIVNTKLHFDGPTLSL